MDDSLSFNLGFTQSDHNEPTNRGTEFIPGEFDYEDPNFVENRTKHRNDSIKMKH